jgi:hypothetical protein
MHHASSPKRENGFSGERKKLDPYYILHLVGVREKVTKALHSLPSCIGVVGVDKKLGALSVQVVDLIYT